MIETLKQWDTSLLLFLNSKHNDFFDIVMYWMTKGWIWFPIYLLLLFFIIKHYKYQTFYIIIAYALLISLTDQISVQLFKNNFHRLRPSHEPLLNGLIHIVNNYRGGTYGFISSHATNFFGITTLTIMLLRNKVKYLPILLLSWASIVCYTRIYLGVHYPGDIICGAIVGVIIAFGVYYFYSFIDLKYLKKIKKNTGVVS